MISSILTALTQEEIDALHESELNDAREKAITEGRKEGLEQGLEEGREEGRKEGRKEGRNEANTLFRLMQKDGRLDDYSRSKDDHELYTRLLKEYGLLK